MCLVKWHRKCGIVLTAFIGIFALATASSVSAQIWEDGDNGEECFIVADFTDDGTTTVILSSLEGPSYALSVTNNNWTARSAAQYEVSAALDGVAFTGQAVGTRVNASPGVLLRVGREFVNEFASASRLTILRGEVVIAVLSLTGSSDGVRRLTACERRLERQRALEASAAEALRRRRQIIPQDPFYDPLHPLPIGNTSVWVTNDDYPPSAIRDGAEGATTFLLTIDRAGAVSGCRVTQSSGNEALDSAACRNASRRARFRPLLDDDTTTGDRTYERQVLWQLPSTP